MPFPSKKRYVYENNQLEKVICQLRFPPILKIDSELPADFQEAIRTEYPLYVERRELVPEINVEVEKQPLQLGNTNLSKNHEFSSEDQVWKVNLARTFLAVSTSKYIDRDSFSSKVEAIYEKLMRIYSPPFFTRIGLRYTDLFIRSRLGLDGISWTELIQPPFLGLLISHEVREDIRNSESVNEVWLSDHESVVRIKSSLVVNVETKEQCFIVDSDFFTTKRTSLADVSAKREFLHQNASNLIQSIITPKLHKAMKPQDM